MWIKMLATYIGPRGTFPKGQEYDLAESILAEMDGNSEGIEYYKHTVAPWDKHKDPRLAELADAEIALKDAIDSHKQAVSAISIAQQTQQKHVDALKEAQAKAAQNKKDVRSQLECDKANGLVAVLDTDAKLRVLDMEDAHTAIENATKRVKKLKAEIATERVAKEKAKNAKTKPEKTGAAAEAKNDNANAKG